MKQKMKIGLWVIAGTVAFVACERSTENNAAMKVPLESAQGPAERSPNHLTDSTARIIAGEKLSK